MPVFSVTTDIDAPPARVWDVIRDVERWREWTPSITSVRRLDTGPFAIGTRAIVRQPKLLPAFWRVSALEPGKSFTWISSAPGVRAIGYHAVAPAGSRSRGTLSLEYQGLFGKLFARLLRGITERYLRFEADGLRRRSENPDFRIQSEGAARRP